MGEFDFKVGVAFRDSANLAALKALTTAVGLTDGAVLGDPSGGQQESGVSYATAGSRRDKSPVSGSFTRPAADFLKEIVETFSFVFPLSGNKQTTTATPVDGDFQHDEGIDAILGCCGLVGAAWGSGVGWRYAPASSAAAAARVWFENNDWALDDIFGNLTIEYTPGGLALATAELEVGTVDTFTGDGAFPTFTYGVQASIANPTVESLAHAWGAGAVARSFNTLTIRIDNAIETLQDSNAVGGERKRQTGRTIQIEGDIWAIDDGSEGDYEHGELVRTTAPTDQQIFTVGTPAVGSDPALAHRIIITNPSNLNMEPITLGGKHANRLTLDAVDAAANGEFEMIFL